MAKALQRILRDERRAPVFLIEVGVAVLLVGVAIGLGAVAYLR